MSISSRVLPCTYKLENDAVLFHLFQKFCLDESIYVQKFRNIVFRLFHKLPPLLFLPRIRCLAVLADFTCEHGLVQNLAIPYPCFLTENLRNLRFKIPKWPRLASSELLKETGKVTCLKIQISLSSQLICLFLGELYSSAPMSFSLRKALRKNGNRVFFMHFKQLRLPFRIWTT